MIENTLNKLREKEEKVDIEETIMFSGSRQRRSNHAQRKSRHRKSNHVYDHFYRNFLTRVKVSSRELLWLESTVIFIPPSSSFCFLRFGSFSFFFLFFTFSFYVVIIIFIIIFAALLSLNLVTVNIVSIVTTEY